MGAVKCIPQKEQPSGDAEKNEEKQTTISGDAADIEEQLQELQRKYEDSQKALRAQKEVQKVQEQRINEFQALSEQSKNELLEIKNRGGRSLALSAVMMKFAKEGSGKAASRQVNFLHTETGENVVILTTESSGAVKRYSVQGVSSDPKSASLSKLKNDEGDRMLILDCEGKKVPLLVETQEVRDKWLNTISQCLPSDDIKE